MPKTIADASAEELQAELEKRKRADAGLPTPLTDPDWTPLRATVVRGIERAWADGYEDDDLRAYVYEAAMQAVYGPWIFEAKRRRFA